MSSYKESNGPTIRIIPPRPWATKFCGCFSYKDKYGLCTWWPHFCPFALFITGITAGQICSHLNGERRVCCDMGIQGCLLCTVSTPISLYSIPGGVACFFCISIYQRDAAIRQWNVIEEKACCCGPCNPIVEFFHFHCNYPCSLFQIYMSVLEYEYDERNRQATNTTATAVVVAPPIAIAAVDNTMPGSPTPSAPAMPADSKR